MTMMKSYGFAIVLAALAAGTTVTAQAAPAGLSTQLGADARGLNMLEQTQYILRTALLLVFRRLAWARLVLVRICPAAWLRLGRRDGLEWMGTWCSAA
jgi:hypothetical protein